MNLNFKNVLIYMPDSVRWDRRDSFSGDNSIQIKTAAHSTYTFTSMPSMLTGYLPHRHGVYSQRHSPMFDPVEEGLFNIAGYNTYIKANQILAGMFEEGVGTVWRHIDESHSVSHVDDLEPPFIYFEADSGGHAPYNNGKDYDSGWEFLHDTANDSDEEFASYYDRSVNDSAERLEQMVDELEDRGLRDDTLIIVTSDHGEHLREYGGLVGHLHPATPELVYVPTVVRHPGIVDQPLPDFIHHVDLLPTVFDVLDVRDDYDRDGESFLRPSYHSRPVINLTQFYPSKLSSLSDPCLYFQESLWDADGGHVFNKHNMFQRVLFYIADQLIERKAMGGKWKGFHPASIRESSHLYLQQHVEFGEPAVSRTKAKQLLNKKEQITSEMTELEDETEDRLRELGYI